MKLTLWQQFSSNHSSIFYVVGEFASHQAAASARDTLITLYKEGMAVFDDNDAFGETTYGQLVEDQYAIDVPLDAVTFVVGNLLIAQENIDTWTYKAPVEALLRYVKAQDIVGFDVEEQADFVDKQLEIKFTAPDATTALRLDAALTTYFASLPATSVQPPWSDLTGLFAQILPNSRYLHPDSVALLQARWDEDYEIGKRVAPGSPSVRNMPLALVTPAGSPSSYNRTELDFRMTGVFSDEMLALAVFIAWLEQQGCTDIHLRYV